MPRAGAVSIGGPRCGTLVGKRTRTFSAQQGVFGVTKLGHLDAAIAALDLTLDDDEIAILGHE